MEKQITAVVTTSPLPSHPSTHFIDQAYRSIRFHLPSVPVVILADGVHPKNAQYKEQYEEYKTKLWALDWPNTELIEFPDFTHQMGMIRTVFERAIIRTPFVLWCEHDMALTQDFIDWEKILQALTDRETDSVRFSDTNSSITGGWQTSPADLYTRKTRSGLDLLYTREFLTWPNIARRELYKAIIDHAQVGQTHLEFVGRDFIEHTEEGKTFQLAIYNPPQRKRAVNFDGRQNMERPPWTF